MGSEVVRDGGVEVDLVAVGLPPAVPSDDGLAATGNEESRGAAATERVTADVLRFQTDANGLVFEPFDEDIGRERTDA